MKKDIRVIWRALRPLLKDGCTFAEIKNLVAASGLPVEALSRLQQKSLPAKGATKTELQDAIDDLIGKEQNPAKAIQRLLGAFLERKAHLHSKVSQCVQGFGWTLEHGQLKPSDFQVEGVSEDFSDEVRQLLRTAYARYGQGDYSGAMTVICSALDNVTRRMYAKHSLGDPKDDSYQQRVSRSFLALEKSYRACFPDATFDKKEVNLMWQNYKGAINQSAFVLGALRRNASDVHGLLNCPSALVRHAIDCGTFIIRSISSEINGDTQQLDTLDF